MTKTVRETKRADELKPGDWLVEDENGNENPNEVKAAFQYPTAYGMRVHLTTQVPGKNPCSCGDLSPEATFALVTEAELAALREKAERAQQISDIRALADWLEANPWAPVPNYYDANAHLDGRHVGGPTVAEAYVRVHEVAGQLGVNAEERLDDRTTVSKTFGKVTYQVIAWHPNGRPAEPVPEPADDLGDAFDRSQTADADLTPPPVKGRRREPHAGAVLSGIAQDGHPLGEPIVTADESLVDEKPEHYQISGSAGGPGENDADCACGVSFTGFDTHAEAQEQLGFHIQAPS